MKDRQAQSDDWIGEWIARQRELLERNAAQSSQASDDNSAEVLRRWFDAGQMFFSGLTPQPAQPNADAAGMSYDPFNIGSALVGAWSTAGMFQSSFAQQASDALGQMPPIGLAREQTEAWRELAAAYAQCRQIENELRAVLTKVQFDALDLLNQRVHERGTSEPIENFRTLYDLWVECGEQVYSKLAHSAAYSKLQAELGNATMRLRSRLQVVVEQGLKQLDLPTRSELNSLHRQVRELRLQIEQLTSATRPQPKAKAKSGPAVRKAKSRARAKAKPKRRRP